MKLRCHSAYSVCPRQYNTRTLLIHVSWLKCISVRVNTHSRVCLDSLQTSFTTVCSLSVKVSLSSTCDPVSSFVGDLYADNCSAIVIEMMCEPLFAAPVVLVMPVLSSPLSAVTRSENNFLSTWQNSRQTRVSKVPRMCGLFHDLCLLSYLTKRQLRRSTTLLQCEFASSGELQEQPAGVGNSEKLQFEARTRLCGVG